MGQYMSIIGCFGVMGETQLPLGYRQRLICKALGTSAGTLLLKALIASRVHCHILLELFWDGHLDCVRVQR